MKSLGLALVVFAFLACRARADDTPLASDIAAAVAAQVARLQSSDPAVRMNAVEKLSNMGEEAAAAVPALVPLLGDEGKVPEPEEDDENHMAVVGEEAAQALRYLGPAGQTALLAALKDPRPAIRERAARGLGYGTKSDLSPIPGLLAAAGDPGAEVRAAAVEALGQFFSILGQAGHEAPEERGRLVEALRKALQDPEWPVRERAAMAFRSDHEDAAFQALVNGLQEEDPKVRRQAATDLWLYGDEHAVDPLLSALKDPVTVVRARAAEAVGRLPSKLDPRTVPALSALVHDPEATVRMSAVKALGETRDPSRARPLGAGGKGQGSRTGQPGGRRTGGYGHAQGGACNRRRAEEPRPVRTVFRRGWPS